MPNRSRAIRNSGRRLPVVAVFARAPQPGRAKTRLVPVLGPQGAADFQAALLTDTIHKVETLSKIAARWLFRTGGAFPARHLPRGLFRGVRWSSRFAFRDVLGSLSSHGLIASVLSPLADVDRPADLLGLAQQFFYVPAPRRRAPATWGFVKGRMPTT